MRALWMLVILVLAFPAHARADALTEPWSSRTVDLDLSGVPSGAYQLTSGQLKPSLVNMSGQLIIEASFTASADMATLFPDGGADVYILSADTTSAGDVSVRLVASDSSIRFAVGGADRVTLPAYPTLTNEYVGWLSGETVTVRAWYDPAHGIAGMRWSDQGLSFEPVVAGVASPPVVPPPTAVYLGSNRGTGSLPAQWTHLNSYQGLPLNPDAWPVDFVILGDSNTASLGPYYGAYRHGWPSKILQPSEIANGRNRGANIAVPGGQLETQLTVWQTSSYRGRGEVRWVGVMLGVNDTLVGHSVALMESDMTTLVADVHATAHNAKVVGVQYFPERQYTGLAPNLQALNAALGSCGADYVVSGHVVALDVNPASPTFTLNPIYGLDGPPALHCTDPAEAVIGANYVRPTLLGAGLIH